MTLNRRLAVLLLAASLGSAALAQERATLDDETIFTAVEQALQGSPSLANARIAVRSRDGFVTLTGFADSMKDVATAGLIASRVRGVIGLDNEIQISDRSSRV
jgi:osmotically-inducible protein OsmY